MSLNRRRLLKWASCGIIAPISLSLLTTSKANGINFSGNLSKKQRLQHEGRFRSYRVYLPNSLSTTPAPAILLLHGHGGSADQLLGLTGRKAPFRLWLPIADKEGLILIIPDGLVSPDGKRGWNDARNIATNPSSNDIDFLLTLLETIAASFPIDFKRVYATGVSNGGHMVLRLAAEASDQLAAVAAVAGANPDPSFVRKPDYPISVMLMNGTRDRFVPYDGGSIIRDRGRVQSTNASIQYWATHNNCGATPSVRDYPNRSRLDGCRASRYTYRGTNNTEVSLIRILRGGHTEPSIQQPYSRLFLAIVGRQNQDIEMAEEVWKFFQGKSR